MSVKFDAGVQIHRFPAGRMHVEKAVHVDQKVNISCYTNPPGNILHLWSHVALTAAVITSLQ